jgi:putative salt-induced outer membrane protein YdiY
MFKRIPKPAPRLRAVALGLLILSAAGLAQTPAQTPEKAENKGLLGPWKATAELGFVLTSGNSSTSTFSLATTFKRAWEKDALTVKAYVLTSHTSTVTRTAQGTETDYTVTEDKTSRLVAENFALSGQYDHRLSEKVVLQSSLGWDRNRFAGLAGRVILTAGTGYAWVETKRTVFKTDGGFTYTWRQYYDQDATSFLGFRAVAKFEQKILESSGFASEFIFDDNLKKTVDWRYDWTNSVTASISKALLLKASLRLVYSNVPADESVPLFDLLGNPTGLTVPVPLKKLDSYFTTSFVFNF